MLFDNKLNLSDHFNIVVSICYGNLRNLGKIAFKLSVKLKIQLVHWIYYTAFSLIQCIFLSFHKYGYFFGLKLLPITLTNFDVAWCWIIHFSLWIFVIYQLIVNAAK